MKKVTGLLFASLLLLSTGSVSNLARAADCYVLQSPTVNIAIRSLKIDPDMPVGAVLRTQHVNTRTYPASYTCGSQALYYASTMGSNFSKESSISGVYETGLIGVGIRVSDIVYRDQWVPYTKSPAKGTWNGADATGTIKIELIKTGPLGTASSGKFKTGTLVTAKVNSRNTAMGASQIYEIRITSVPSDGWVVKSCTISNANRNQIVQMGTISKSDFSSAGYGPTRNFTIQVDCPDGIPDELPIRITYDRMTTGSADGYMDVDTTVENSAENVGVEVRDQNDSLLKFATAYEYRNASVDNKKILLPMTARYKAATTVGNINPGTANTAMTITIDQD